MGRHQEGRWPPRSDCSLARRRLPALRRLSRRRPRDPPQPRLRERMGRERHLRPVQVRRPSPQPIQTCLRRTGRSCRGLRAQHGPVCPQHPRAAHLCRRLPGLRTGGPRRCQHRGRRLRLLRRRRIARDRGDTRGLRVAAHHRLPRHAAEVHLRRRLPLRRPRREHSPQGPRQ